jgi:hypothetical protein
VAFISAQPTRRSLSRTRATVTWCQVPPADQPSLFLGQCGVKVQRERVGVCAKLGDDKRHALRHQAADEMNVAAQSSAYLKG